MNAEVKVCQNCHEEFTIEGDDFGFYEKIKVPPPTFCPKCRLIRRMTWRNERSLFKRLCAKTGKPIITMFHPEADFVIYDHEVWWGDSWDPTQFGMDYDFSRPFFEQYKELLFRTPLANVGNTNCVGSPYGNHNADCKYCYLMYASFNNERTHYSYGAVGLKDCIDTYVNINGELSYGDTLCEGLYKTHFSYDTDESINSFFLKHCKNCQDCIGCINLRHKSHCIFNVEYSKEEYETIKKSFDFGSYKFLKEFEEKYNQFTFGFPNKYANIIKSTNVTGDNIINSKNAKNCFDLYGETEDSKYLIHFVDGKDCYDLYGGGAVASMMYEGADVGLEASRVYFAVLSHSCLDTYYTYMCYNAKNLFGCIGVRGKQYCILNKQYTKEEYFELVPKIIEHMKTMPYIDKNNHVHRYGEFFPSEISPFAYNETIAQEYFPKTKEEIEERGYFYREPVHTEYQITIKSEELPDHIKDVTDSIVNEVIACPNGGQDVTQCTKAYRIIEKELEFLKNNNIALPRYCPNCRHYKRLSKRNPLKLWQRSCMCEKGNHTHEGKCEVEFETAYAPDRPEVVYCEKCYQQEVY